MASDDGYRRLDRREEGQGRRAMGDLEQVMAALAEGLETCLPGRLLSLVVYGSAVFDDLAPGYGDLDVLAVVSGDLVVSECERLIALRADLRRASAGVLASMVEGAILPRAMLSADVTGLAVWWGTRGERIWRRNALGPFDLAVIREHGRVVHGCDLRDELPLSAREEMIAEALRSCCDMRVHAPGGGLHQVDWLLTASRLLLWARADGRLSSKTEAADWAFHHAAGEWRRQVPAARDLRKAPHRAAEPGVRQWLQELAPAISAAADEVEAALRTLI